MALTIQDKDALLERCKAINPVRWRVRAADKKVTNLKTLQNANWVNWNKEPIEEALPDVLDELETHQKYVVIDMLDSETAKAGTTLCIDYTPSKNGMRGDNIAGMGANYGMYGITNPKDLERKLREEIRREYETAEQIGALEAQVQELKKGTGTMAMINGILEKIPQSTIDMVIARVADAFLPAPMPRANIAGQGFSHDEHDEHDEHEDYEEANEGDAQPAPAKDVNGNRIINVIKRTQTLVGGTPLDAITFLEKLLDYADANPSMFNVIKQQING